MKHSPVRGSAVIAAKQYLAFAVALFFCLFVTSAFANEVSGVDKDMKSEPEQAPVENYYYVEYVLFEHLDQSPDVLRFEPHPAPKERVPDAYYVDYGDATFSLSDLYSDKRLSQHHRLPLPIEEQSLNSAVRRLERDRTVEVIQHRAWLQAFPEEGDQRSVLGANLQLAKDGNLQGTVTIRKSRYMHIDADFAVSQSVAFYAVNWFDWMTQRSDISLQALLTPVRAEKPERYSDSPIYASALTIESENPLGLGGEASGDVNGENVDSGEVENEVLPLTWFNFDRISFKASRRIKDAEMHYLDHPKFGMVATIRRAKLEDDYE